MTDLRSLWRRLALCLLALGLLAGFTATGPAKSPQAQQPSGQPAAARGSLPADWAKAFTWRSLGPANMGGRITAITVSAQDPSLWWVATASGGLLKTSNNGVTFEHQFDREATVSIGDVCVAPSNPNIVWVGTGENNPRNSVSYGDGVYKSTDGGKTWVNMGLKRTFQIGKVLIHPNNPNIVYVGALGRLYGPNEERGLFKTSDGGKTWEKVLYVDDKTGIIDMIMHPTQPDTLIVATWERQRDGFDSWPGTEPKQDGYDGYDPIKKWGPGSGLFRTTDGGKSWKRITAGLPSGKMGRIGLDWYRKNPNVVYAIIDCENIGKGQPGMPVYLGIVAEVQKGKLRLTQVQADSPAARAGLKEGDFLVSVGDKAVKNFNEALEQLRSKRVGDKVALRVGRNGDDTRMVEVTLAARPGTQTRGTGGGGRRPQQPALSAGYVGLFGEDVKEGGAKIVRLTEDGPAEKAGLQEGDIIQSMDGKKVANYQDFTTRLRALKIGDKTTLTVLRDKQTRQIVVTVEARPGGPSPTRPHGYAYGGQAPNIQDLQGDNGHEFGGVYRSDDGGISWRRVNSLNPRPMYFSCIRVDPSDDRRVYVLGVAQHASSDGGVTFNSTFGRGVHADGHALWINPKDGRHMLIGTDGGTYQTYDRGANWDHFNQMAIGQFYHVDISPTMPYWVAGGLQDNGSWAGPSAVSRGPGPINEDWISVGSGDGYTCRFDPFDPDTVYYTSQDGGLGRRNLKTGEMGMIRPTRQRGQPPHRFNWNTPYILSTHNSRIYYCGSQYVLRSFNRGRDLRPISPELTLTKRGSLTALAESTRNPDILWAGSDDGALWVTRNGGKDWTNVTKNLGLPAPRWISTIEASRFVDGRAYVCVDAHRSDDDEPYLFSTEDFGQTWKPIRANLPTGSTRCLREDRSNPELLYCGTEFAFYVSTNRGNSWTKFNNNLPTVAIHEIAQHPTCGEIVVATHGRSLWAVDVTALRQMTGEKVTVEPTLFKPNTAIAWRQQPQRGRSGRRFAGENPSREAQIFYALPQKAEKVELKIVDIEGNVVRTLRATANAGLNKVSWDLSPAPPTAQQGGGGGGRRPEQPRQGGRGGFGGFAGFGQGRAVAAGSYRVVLTVDGKTLSQTLRVEADPTVPAPSSPQEEPTPTEVIDD